MGAWMPDDGPGVRGMGRHGHGDKDVWNPIYTATFLYGGRVWQTPEMQV